MQLTIINLCHLGITCSLSSTHNFVISLRGGQSQTSTTDLVEGSSLCNIVCFLL